MRKLIASGALLLMVLAAPIASAQTISGQTAGRRHPVQRTLQSFQQRIRQGVRSGHLTPAEVSALRSRMSSIRQEVAGLRTSGTRPTIEQRRHLQQQLRQTHRAIFRAKHGR